MLKMGGYYCITDAARVLLCFSIPLESIKLPDFERDFGGFAFFCAPTSPGCVIFSASPLLGTIGILESTLVILGLLSGLGRFTVDITIFCPVWSIVILLFAMGCFIT